jgi:hypothetical protein
LRGAEDSVAFLYGPVVLAGDLGPVQRGETFPYAEDQAANLEADSAAVPELIGQAETIANALRRVDDGELLFRARGSSDGRPVDVSLRPFAELAYRHYNVYWSLTPSGE